MPERIIFQMRMAKVFKQRIVKAAEYQDKTMSEYVREAIREKLEKEGR